MVTYQVNKVIHPSNNSGQVSYILIFGNIQKDKA